MASPGSIPVPNLNSIWNPAAAPSSLRFVKSQIPDSILTDSVLNATIAALPVNYNFEVHMIVWRVRSSGIVTSFDGASHCFVLGDVTYGACCLDELGASALGADLLVHFGHSCLVPVTLSSLPCLYVFVDISIHL